MRCSPLSWSLQEAACGSTLGLNLPHFGTPDMKSSRPSELCVWAVVLFLSSIALKPSRSLLSFARFLLLTLADASGGVAALAIASTRVTVVCVGLATGVMGLRANSRFVVRKHF